MKKIHLRQNPLEGQVQSEKRKYLDDMQARFRNNENIDALHTLL